MKVALLGHAGSIHTRRWGRGLAARGHHVRILTNSASYGVPSDLATDVLPGSSSASYFFNVLKVRRLLKRFRPDIVHIHYATGYGLWGIAQKSAPLVVTVWGSDVADALAGRFLIAPIVRRALRKARVVTAPSRFLLAQTLRLEPSIEGKIVHIPFGIPVDGDSSRAEHREGPVRIIFAKQYQPIYGPDLAIKAFAAALKDVPDMRLLMLGGGPMRNELEKLIASLSLASNVELRNWIEPDQTQQLIRESNIMVMPSRRESFGVAALEASAAGIPVIAADVGGVPEIVHHERNGLLVPVGDIAALSQAIVRLARDPGLRTRMGEAGVGIARKTFNYEHCLDLTEEVYRRAVSG